MLYINFDSELILKHVSHIDYEHYRKMSHNTQAMVSPIRLGSITTPSGQANDAIHVQPSKASANHPFAVLVFFGGDVQVMYQFTFCICK